MYSKLETNATTAVKFWEKEEYLFLILGYESGHVRLFELTKDKLVTTKVNLTYIFKLNLFKKISY